MKKFKKSFALAFMSILIVAMQLGTLSSANAADATLYVSGGTSFNNQAYSFNTCNNGAVDIVSFSFDLQATNFETDDLYVPPFDTPPSDGPGTISGNTWTGVLGADPDGPGGANGECVNISAFGHVTGNLGDVVTATLTITSSTQADSTVTDHLTNGSDVDRWIYDPYTIVTLPDIEAKAHLSTTGTITATSEVEYQIDVRNIGEGNYVHNDFFIFAFTLPEGATFVSATDLATGTEADALVLSSCSGGIYLGVDVDFPGLENFVGREVVVCELDVTGNILPPSTTTIYPFSIKIVAGTGIASGDTSVIGILEGNDSDTGEMFGTISRGEDILAFMNSFDNNNVFELDYDPQVLQMTAATCPGQSNVTADGSGCFRVSFNKQVYEPSFTIGALLLDGSGSISSLTKIGDNEWEVIVTGISPNSTSTLQLKPNTVQDYSAVLGNTQVLGENTIRYAPNAPTTTAATSSGQAAGVNSANGVLATTGSNSSDYLIAMMILIAGLTLNVIAQRKRAKA